MRFSRQAGILTLKYAWVKRRHFMFTLFEIVLPSVLFLFVVIAKVTSDVKFRPKEHPAQTFASVPALADSCRELSTVSKGILFFTPINEGTQLLMDRFSAAIGQTMDMCTMRLRIRGANLAAKRLSGFII